MICITKYKYLIFDLDGTITDSAEGVQKSFNYGLEKLGMKVSDHTKLDVIGPPLKESYMGKFNLNEQDAIKAVSFYRERYKKYGMTLENKLYDGIYELLSDLNNAGYILLTGSSKPEEQCKMILEHFKISKFFDTIFGASYDSSRSTKDKVLEYALSKMNITNKEEVVLIGDTRFDLIGADMVGIDAIAVAYGYGAKDDLKKYKSIYIADTIKDLRRYLL